MIGGDFLPTDQELGLVAQLYSQAGCSCPGYIDGDTVAEILSSAAVDLPPIVLTAIWDVADESKSGSLSETCVAIALRLIGWAQSGAKVTADLVNQSGPSPRVKGLAESNAVPSNWPPFTESMRQASQKLFEAYGPVYGLLEGQLSTIPPTTPPQVYEQIRSASDSLKSPSPPSPQILSTPVRPRKPTRPPPPINTSKVNPETSFRSAPSILNPCHQWSVSPSTKSNADKHFDELDTLKVGYIEGDIVAQFMRGFELMPEDLASIWDLSNFNHDFRLSRDEFVIAMHLIEQRISGVELPSVLPASLIPPSLRVQPPHTTLRRSSTSTSHMESVSPVDNNMIRRSSPLSPKPTCSNHLSRHSPPASKVQAISPKSPFALHNGHHSLAIPQDIDFELPPVEESGFDLQKVHFEQYRILQQQHSSLSLKVEELSAQISARQDPCVASKHVSLEQYRSLEEENSRLSAKIRDLTRQIDVLHDVQSRNETLSQDKVQLLAKIQEMEQITSDLLQSNETISTLGQLQAQVNNAELNECVSELKQLRPQLEDAMRRLNNALGENRDLSQLLREARESAEAECRRAAMELQNMKENIEVLEKDKKELQDRTKTLQRAIAKAASNSKTTPEMVVLMDDITRENENLKQRLRQTESSATKLLLSTKGEAERDKLRSTNQQLTSEIHHLEQLVVQLQQSSEELELQRVLKNVTKENEQLKGSLRETELEVTRLQQTARQVEPLEAQVEELKAEIRRLHCENLRAQAREEESPVAPPAYDEGPVH
ncbi:hypothetical protein C0993_000267 [Termitomyces sp. T159_Od127]|nr:hypothetical protein C0993_000267 [Termitomyces sp. T159_Od127]